MSSQASSGKSRGFIADFCNMPALLTRYSTGPIATSTCAAMASKAFSSPTSQCQNRPPISSATALPAGLISSTATVAPRAASSRAQASPMPLDPPVTMATPVRFLVPGIVRFPYPVSIAGQVIAWRAIRERLSPGMHLRDGAFGHPPLDRAAVDHLAGAVMDFRLPIGRPGALHRHEAEAVDPRAEGVGAGAGHRVGLVGQHLRQGHDILLRAGEAGDDLRRVFAAEAQL